MDIEDEKSKPGLHILVRGIDKNKNTYIVETCIVQQYNRYSVDYKDVISTEITGLTNEDIKYHPNVKNYIKKQTFQLAKNNFQPSFSFSNNSSYGNPFKNTGANLDTEILELGLEFEYLIASNDIDHTLDEKVDYIYEELLRIKKYTVSKKKIYNVLSKDSATKNTDDNYDTALTNLELALYDLQKYHNYKEIKQLIHQFLL